jgi:ribosomal protein S18 acetylase RimI-like enzyme
VIAVRAVDAEWIDANADSLGAVLLACVADGASVSFLADLTHDRATAFWRARRAGVANGDSALLVAFDGDTPIGTVMVVRAGTDNQPHRGDIAKLLVHPDARGRGVGIALMDAAEAQARAVGLSLLVLDTAGVAAERIYRRMGWIEVGRIPDYALNVDGVPEATTIFYKRV